MMAHGAAGLAVIDAHKASVASTLGVKSEPLVLTDLEKRASKIVPRPTALVRKDGGGHEEHEPGNHLRHT